MAYNFDKIIFRKNTNSVKHDKTELIFGATDLIPMWVADMDFEAAPFIVDALQKRLDHKVFGYTMRDKSFAEAVKSWVKTRHNWDIENDWVKFSPGIVPAINLSVLALTEPGDKILVQPPVYFPFFSAVKDHDRKLIFNELKQDEAGYYKIDFEDFEHKLKEAELFIFCSPHNPVGRVWDQDELLKIGNLCVKHKVKILSDEIHSDLILPGYKHIPIASISEKIAQITLTYIAPTKTFNIAGLNSAVVLSKNKELLDSFQKQIDILHLGMGNIFGNLALETAYSKGAEWVDELNNYIQSNIDDVDQFLKEKLPHIKLIKPEATYLLWLDFRALGMDEIGLKKFLIEKAKLGFNYGSMFGPGGDGFQRMNVGCPKSIVVKAMDQLYNAISKM